MKMKTSELTGPALNWAVAKCVGLLDTTPPRVVVDFKYLSGDDPIRWEPVLDVYYSSAYSPSTDWAQGGPIIEREVIALIHPKYDCWTAHVYDKRVDDESYTLDGPTPLVAAMRCYVASNLGDEVEVPEGL